VYTVGLLLFASALLFAQVPHEISFQGKLVGVSSPVNLEFRIYDAETGGTELWSENHIGVSLDGDGLFNVILGETVPIDTLHFNREYWIEVWVNGAPLPTRYKLTADAYSFRAIYSDTANYAISCAGGGSAQDTFVAYWDSIRGIPADIADGDDFEPNSIDTFVAYWDSIRSIPAGFADGVDNEGSADPMDFIQNQSDSFQTASYNIMKTFNGDQDTFKITAIDTLNECLEIGTHSHSDASYVQGIYIGSSIYGNNSEMEALGVGAIAYGQTDEDIEAVDAITIRWGSGTEGNVIGGNFEASNQTDAFSPSGWDGAVYGVMGTAYNHYSAARIVGVYGKGWGQGTTGPEYSYGIYGTSGNWNRTNYGVYGTTSGTGSGTTYGVYASGNMGCSGTKSAIVRIGDDAYEFYCQESPEIWFEDFGEAKLENGKAHIELEELFLQSCTIDDEHPMHVFITPYGNMGNYYIKRGATGFDVIQIDGGEKDASFGYRVVAKRKGYENIRLRKVDVKDDPLLFPELNPQH